MKQKLLFVCVCLLLMSNMSAQFSAVSVKTDDNLRSATADGTFKFGFCDDEVTQGVGVNQNAALSAAIGMPASKYGIYAGMEITKIRIGLSANCTNVSVWIRNSLDGTNLVSKSVGSASRGWTEVTLDNPFIIPEGDIYIGYTATGNMQVGFSGTPAYDANWLWYNGWQNYVDSGWGSICIQAIINTKGTTLTDAGMERLDKVYSKVNEAFTIKASIRNLSSVTLTSVKFAYAIDNQSPVERVIETSAAPMQVVSLNIPAEPVTEHGMYSLSVTILEINGQSDSYTSNNTLTTELEVIKNIFPKKIVMEEGTGAWCQWCPRGTVGMAIMKEKYPETYIGIAVHNSDPMVVAAYDEAMTTRFFTGFPSMVVNRKKSLVGDPYYDAENFYQAEMATPSQIGIQLSGKFTSAEMKAIHLKTVTTFGYSGNTNLKLAYVLIENGVTGTSSSWWQSNAYAGGQYGQMGGFEAKPSTIKDMVYNDVARGIYSEFSGITGSLPSSVTEMESVEHDYTLTLPASILNKNKLEVAVLLLNSAGEIVNADKIEIADYTGIPAVTVPEISAFISGDLLHIQSAAALERVTVYNISGQKILEKTAAESTISVSQLQPGVYIVKVKTAGGEEGTAKVIK